MERWAIRRLYNGGSSVTHAQQGYFPPGPVSEGFPEDAVLIYSGYYDLGRTGLSRLGAMEQYGVTRSDDGDWLPDDFIPYVAHLDWEGEPDDIFFDTFIFLALASDRGRQFAGELGQEQAALWADWQWYIDRLFVPGKQLSALEQAVAAVGKRLGQPRHGVLIYIMIPYPSYKVTDFGSPDGTKGGPSLLPVENRRHVVEWYIDEVLKRWEAWRPAHLRLGGFYWLQEHVNPVVPDEEQFVRDVARHVHERGLKLGWIPWSGAYLATHWKEYDFDWAIIQPNHMFRDHPDALKVASERGMSAHMGIEIELDGRVKQPQGEKRLHEYLDAGVEYGYMTGAMLAYYLDAYMLPQLYHDQNGRWRHMYDDLYAFAKGTYPHAPDASRAVRGAETDLTKVKRPLSST